MLLSETGGSSSIDCDVVDVVEVRNCDELTPAYQDVDIASRKWKHGDVHSTFENNVMDVDNLITTDEYSMEIITLAGHPHPIEVSQKMRPWNPEVLANDTARINPKIIWFADWGGQDRQRGFFFVTQTCVDLLCKLIRKYSTWLAFTCMRNR
jgi:hypothetical protein